MNLKLYNEYNNEVYINIDKKSKIGGGLFANVYLLNGYAFKEIDFPLGKLSTKALELIKNIKHPNLYKIKDLFYSSNKLECLAAYSMEYYLEDNINILIMPTEYTLDNLYDLRELAIVMAKNNIYMQDLHAGNMIMQGNRIILIDRDNDYYADGNYKNILYHNISEIILGFACSYHQQFELMNKNNESFFNSYENIISSLADCTYDEFAKTLSLYKRPIDYINSEIKKYK